MRVLVACERFGKVAAAFRELGHEAYSCDVESCPIQYRDFHIQDDVLNHLDEEWDLMIAHPPCTYLCRAGAHQWPHKQVEQQEAIALFMKLMLSKIPKIAIENPVGIMSRKFRQPDQMIQPYEFGHAETKKTCLWLKNLNHLKPTKVVEPVATNIHMMSPSPMRSMMRSVTYTGIAQAMAQQWGSPSRRDAY